MHTIRKPKHYLPKRHSPSPIPQVSQTGSTSIDTTAHTIKPMEIFQYLLMKRKCYAFQLVKQFFLFREQEEESDRESEDWRGWEENKEEEEEEKKEEGGMYTIHVRRPVVNQENAQLHLSTMLSTIKRLRQKLLLTAFDQLKKRYFRLKMVYRNREYVENIITKITNLINSEHQQILQYVFASLIQNLKACRLKELISKNLQDMRTPEKIEFEDKGYRTREYLPFHTDDQSGIMMRNDTESFFQSDSRIQIAKDFGLRRGNSRVEGKSSRVEGNSRGEGYSRVEPSPYIPSPYYHQKHPYPQQFYPSPTVRRHLTTRNTTMKQTYKQMIYIVGSDRKFSTTNKPGPKRHIKIPVQTNNIDIIRIKSQHKEGEDIGNEDEDKYSRLRGRGRSVQKMKKEGNENNYTRVLEGDCSQCEFCVRLKENLDGLGRLGVFG